ncbi:MAG: FkbM family methyltransferase [Candidatus Methanomethyliaceae archaeon]
MNQENILPIRLRLVGWFSDVMPPALRRAIYRLPVTDILRRWLNRAAPSGYTWVTVAAGLNKRARLLVDLSCEKFYWLGTYEPDLQVLLPKVLRPGYVAYDVGAHAGFFSVAMAHLVGPLGQVFAFEPLPENADKIEAVAIANNLPRLVTIRRAVADRCGEAVLYHSGSTSTSSLLGGSSGITVSLVTLDEFVYGEGYPPPQLVKLDVEGAESMVLQGMERLVAEYSPILVIEVHKGQSEAVWSWLVQHNYIVYRCTSWRHRIRVDEATFSSGHYLAMPKS